ncbi:MAG: alpha/beta hydrolase [Haloarculaceae archaeon]
MQLPPPGATGEGDDATGRPITDASVLGHPSAESTHREVNGVELHVVTAGDPADPLVVLLHGFPEFWYGWHRQVGPLVDAGFRVLVPDQRGYASSGKPDGVRPYRRRELVRDVVGLVGTEDCESAHVVGHDWGGVVAWDLACRRPDLVERLGIVNVPHPRAFRRLLPRSPEQLWRSRYVLYVQFPRLPEWAVRRGDFALWVRTLRDGARPGTFIPTDAERYRAAWRHESAPTAMLNWYRALPRYPDHPPRERVTAPTVILWGEDDPALVPELARRSLDLCEDGRLERFPRATHWVHHDYPERVANLLVEHLGGPRTRR